MAAVQFSPQALNDLREIKRYIGVELENDIAAEDTLRRIVKRIRGLATFPNMGALLSSVVETEKDYRFLVCDNYLVFYRCEEDTVFIIRVLYGRSDYMRILPPEG